MILNLMKYLQKQKKSGFGLIEIIIYMGLLSIVLLVVTNLLISTSYFSQEEAARLEIQKNGRFIMERIIRDLENCTQVITPADSNPTNNLICSSDSGQITYQLTADRLTRTDSISTESATGNLVKIDAIAFNRIANLGGQVSIKMEITVNYIGQILGNRNIAQTFTTTYSLK